MHNFIVRVVGTISFPQQVHVIFAVHCMTLSLFFLSCSSSRSGSDTIDGCITCSAEKEARPAAQNPSMQCFGRKDVSHNLAIKLENSSLIACSSLVFGFYCLRIARHAFFNGANTPVCDVWWWAHKHNFIGSSFS